MKKSFVFLVFSIFLFAGCGVATIPDTNSASDTGYSLSADGTNATVSTSKGLKDMLAKSSVTVIKLEAGNYADEYDVNDAKEINGSLTTTINKISVNCSDVTIRSSTITTLIAGKGIEEGELTLEDVIIEGDAVFQGGGSNSIKVLGKSIFKGLVTLDKAGISFKMGTLTEIIKSLIVLQPASIMPLDENTLAPAIKGDIVINYTKYSSVATVCNIIAAKLVVGDTVNNVTLGAKSVIAMVYATKSGTINITNNGKIESANDLATILGNKAENPMPVDLSTDYQLQGIITLSKLNNSLFSVSDINSITDNFDVQTNFTISDDTSIVISWTSNNSSVLSISGEKISVTQPDVTTPVILTASVTIDGSIIKKDFTVTVIAKVNPDNLTNLPAEADGTWTISAIPLSFTVSDSKITMNGSTNPVQYDKTNGQMYYKKENINVIMKDLFWKDSAFYNKGVLLTKGTGSAIIYSNLPVEASGTWAGSTFFTVSGNKMSMGTMVFEITYDSATGLVYGTADGQSGLLSGILWKNSAFIFQGEILTKVTLITLPADADGTWTMSGSTVLSVSGGKMTMGPQVIVITYDSATGLVYGDFDGQNGPMTGLLWKDSAFIFQDVTLTKLTLTTLPVEAEGAWTMPGSLILSVSGTKVNMGNQIFDITYDSSTGVIYGLVDGQNVLMPDLLWKDSAFIYQTVTLTKGTLNNFFASSSAKISTSSATTFPW